MKDRAQRKGRIDTSSNLCFLIIRYPIPKYLYAVVIYCCLLCTNAAGNELFKQKQYHEAAIHYTKAMKMNPKDPKVSILIIPLIFLLKKRQLQILSKVVPFLTLGTFLIN